MTDCVVVRSMARRFAMDVGFDELRAAEVAIVAGELASNIVKHGGASGRLTLRRTPRALHVIAIDRGPGLTNPETLRAAEGMIRLDARQGLVGLGHGWGAVHRLMDRVKSARRRGGGLLVHGLKRFQFSEVTAR